MSMKIVVAGGGWAGCAAALSAVDQGAHVTLIERTDMLLGTGLVGGIMRNNGRFTAAEEMIAMGGGELFRLIDLNCLHRNIEFPGHKHASLYNVATMEPIIRKHLQQRCVRVLF
jgi:glycine/D-amino acid oxidase-like deaminating enzyme